MAPFYSRTMRRVPGFEAIAAVNPGILASFPAGRDVHVLDGSAKKPQVAGTGMCALSRNEIGQVDDLEDLGPCKGFEDLPTKSYLHGPAILPGPGWAMIRVPLKPDIRRRNLIPPCFSYRELLRIVGRRHSLLENAVEEVAGNTQPESDLLPFPRAPAGSMHHP